MYLEESRFLKKGVSKVIKNEVKDQKGRFLGMLLGTLGTGLSWKILAGKEATETCEFLLVNRQLGWDKTVNVAEEGL